MALQPEGPAPYAPAGTIIALMDGYRERGYATPFTAEVLVRAGVSDSLVNRTLHSLKLLGLVKDDGNTTATFEDLKRTRGQDEYRSALAAWLYETYADVLQYADPTRDGADRVAEAFRGYQPEGQRSRMVTLMLGLFEYAGLIEHATSPQPKRKTAAPAGKRPPGKKVASESKPGVAVPSPRVAVPGTDGLAPELVGLLHAVPRDGNGWTIERRDAFVNAFTAVLNYSIPVVSPVVLDSPPREDE